MPSGCQADAGHLQGPWGKMTSNSFMWTPPQSFLLGSPEREREREKRERERKSESMPRREATVVLSLNLGNDTPSLCVFCSSETTQYVQPTRNRRPIHGGWGAGILSRLRDHRPHQKVRKYEGQDDPLKLLPICRLENSGTHNSLKHKTVDKELVSGLNRQRTLKN